MIIVNKELPPYPLVHVAWVDSLQALPEWQDLNDLDLNECPTMQTVGWLINNDETKSMIVIAQSVGALGDDGWQGAGLVRIPSACVTTMTTLVDYPAS